MSLIRCPRCKLDTSDSLDRCPNCGLAMGSVASIELAGWSRDATPAPSPSTSATPAARAWSGVPRQLLHVPRVLWVILVLVVLATVPHAFPLLIVLAIAWQLWQRSQSGERTVQSEAWRVFLRELQGGAKSAPEKPLERLQRIERELGRKRDA
jgi:hypothetical protein